MSAEATPFGTQPLGNRTSEPADSGGAVTGGPVARRTLRALLRAGSTSTGRNRAEDPLHNLLTLHRQVHPKA